MSVRDYAREFQDNERKYAYDFDAVLRRYMMRALDAHMVPGSALEMGCFEGGMTELLAQRFDDLTVIEAAGELITRARTRVPAQVRFVESRFEDAQFSQQFDTVFLVHTLEHLDDPVGVMRRVGHWLRPGGRLIVVVPNAYAPSRQIAV